jgi:hypothetical protein
MHPSPHLGQLPSQAAPPLSPAEIWAGSKSFHRAAITPFGAAGSGRLAVGPDDTGQGCAVVLGYIAPLLSIQSFVFVVCV